MSTTDSRFGLRLLAGLAAIALLVTTFLTGEADATWKADKDETCKPFTLTVLHNNDGESALMPSDTTPEEAGVARFATLVEKAKKEALVTPKDRDRRQNTRGVIFLSSGDNFLASPAFSAGTETGTLYDALVVRLMEYDAVAIGNHEFDFGPDVLAQFIQQAKRPPFLSANLDLSGEPALAELASGRNPRIAASVVIKERGERIGVIGATTLSTPETTLPANVESYEFRDIAEVVNELAPRLKAEGADLVVLVVHAGAIATRDEGYVGEIVDAARRITAPLDLIVSGHTHSEVRAEVNGIPIVQARSSGTALGVVTLTFDRGQDAVVGHSIDVWTTRHEGVAPDPDIVALVEAYAANVESLAGREIARLARPLRRDRDDESALGDLIADAQRAATGDRIALVNGGGIRTDLDAGPVTYADAFAVQPFQNTLISLELTGEQLRQALEAVVEDRLGEVSGIRYRFDPTRPKGRRVLDAWLEEGGEAVVRDGAAVHPDAAYTVTANNFMASGGSGYDVLAEAEGTSTGLVDSEVLVEYLAGLPQPIEYEKRGRVERLAPWPEDGR